MLDTRNRTRIGGAGVFPCLEGGKIPAAVAQGKGLHDFLANKPVSVYSGRLIVGSTGSRRVSVLVQSEPEGFHERGLSLG